MNSWQYRLKKGARSHKGLDRWELCTDDQKKQIEATSPGRFEFKEAIKAEVPPAAIVEDKPKRGRPKKEKREDK